MKSCTAVDPLIFRKSAMKSVIPDGKNMEDYLASIGICVWSLLVGWL